MLLAVLCLSKLRVLMHIEPKFEILLGFTVKCQVKLVEYVSLKRFEIFLNFTLRLSATTKMLIPTSCLA